MPTRTSGISIPCSSRTVHSLNESATDIESLEDMAVSQRRNLGKTLADILTIDIWQADALIDEYPDDAVALYQAFAVKTIGYGDHAREWRSSTMALLPRQYWVSADGPDGPHVVDDNPYASLRHLSHRETDTAKALQAMTNRRALYRALTEILSQDARGRYAPLLEWDETELTRFEEGQSSIRYPYLNDMALGHLLHAVELMFDQEYGIAEQSRRPATLQPVQATSPDLIPELAAAAASGVHACMAAWSVTDLLQWTRWDMGVTAVGESPAEIGDIGQRDHLVLSVLCNLAANRVLLERSRLQVLAIIGAHANCVLLSALNRNGVESAPHPHNYSYDLAGIRALLLAWLGPNGALAGDPILRMPLKGQDLEVILAQSDNIQGQYIHSRGHMTADQYRSGYDRFLVALAVAACHVAEIKLPDEFLSGKQRPAFPARNLGERRMELVGPEALELIKAMYGQLLYGNQGEQLSASGVQRYADCFRLRHAHMQELLFNMFKRLTPSQLLHFDGVMMRLAHKNESGLEEQDRKATSNANRLIRLELALEFFYQVAN